MIRKKSENIRKIIEPSGKKITRKKKIEN